MIPLEGVTREVSQCALAEDDTVVQLESVCCGRRYKIVLLRPINFSVVGIWGYHWYSVKVSYAVWSVGTHLRYKL